MDFEEPEDSTDGLDGCGARTGHDGRIRSINMLRQYNRDAANRVERDVRGRTGNLPSRLSKIQWDPRRKIISHVVRINDEEHAKQLYEVIKQTTGRSESQFILYVSNIAEGHGHIVHDCICHRGTCRCAFAQSSVFQTFQGRRTRNRYRGQSFAANRTEEDWLNITIYYLFQQGCHNRRGEGKDECVLFFPKAGTTETYNLKDNNVRWNELQEFVLGCQPTVSFPNLGDVTDMRRKKSILDSYGEDDESTHSLHKRQRGSIGTKKSFEGIVQAIFALLSTCITVPINNALKMVNEVNWQLWFFQGSKQSDITNAVQLYYTKINNYLLSDFYKLSEKIGVGNIYRATSRETIFDYYESRAKSLENLNAILLFQYNNNVSKIVAFLESVVSWFNKKGIIVLVDDQFISNLKCQCYICIGPPNSGKTYFWQAISDLAINVGTFARINNKTNGFSMQEIVNRRMVVGNEMNIEEGAMEDLKKIFEGSACNVRVKCKPDANFERTPIIITSNDYTFYPAVHPDFVNVRTVVEYWNALPEVQHDLKPAYPLAFFDLLSMYGVGFE